MIRFLMIIIAILSLNSTALTQNEPHRFKMIFVGDIMGHDSQIASAQIVKDSLYDYQPCFEYIAPLLENVNLAVGNLEVTLPGKPPYKGYPQFRSHSDLALALRSAGFDMLVTANNHSNDARKTGVINTIKTLDDYGFYYTGTFENPEQRRAFYPLIVYKDNFKIAFLNYTYGTNGIPTIPPTIVNLIEEEQIKKDLIEAKALNPDFIVTVMHWGNEYQLIESKKQDRLADSVFQWGSDLIIGAHPHVVQPIKEYKRIQPDSSIKREVIAFSLGNFVSGQRRKNTDGGLMFEVEIEKKTLRSKAKVVGHRYIPVWRYIQRREGKSIYRIVPISAFEDGKEELIGMNAADRAAMKSFAKTTRDHLSRFASRERILTLNSLGLGLQKDIKKLKR